MKLLFLFTVLWLALSGCVLVRDKETAVIAQVSTRPVAGQDLSDQARIAVRFTLRAPEKLRGAEFYFVTLATQPTEVEKRFPFRGVWEIRLPWSTIPKLKEQIAARKSIGQQIKAGIDPLEISQTVSVTLIRSEDLTAEPKTVRIQP